MLELLINFVFKIVNKLISTIMSPLINGITALFPSLGTFFTTIASFFTTASTYVISVSNLLLIPRTFWTALFTYFEIKYSIYLILLTAKGTIKLYEKFKP